MILYDPILYDPIISRYYIVKDISTVIPFYIIAYHKNVIYCYKTKKCVVILFTPRANRVE